MIQILYRGGLGENLFQYCFGRIMAERWQHELQADPIPHFPGTAEPVSGKRYYSPHQSWSGSAVEERQLGILLREKDLAIPYEGRLMLFGWFQRWELYQAHADKIRKWLRVDAPPPEPAGENDIAICLRSSRPMSWNEPGIHAGRAPNWKRTLPIMRNVVELLERTPHDRVLVFSDNPISPELEFLMSFNPIVRYSDTFSSWNMLRSCQRIITSVCHAGDFWAAWLSEAKQIFALDPWPQSVPAPCSGPYGCGWSNSRPLARPNMHVNEERWIYDW